MGYPSLWLLFLVHTGELISVFNCSISPPAVSAAAVDISEVDIAFVVLPTVTGLLPETAARVTPEALLVAASQ